MTVSEVALEALDPEQYRGLVDDRLEEIEAALGSARSALEGRTLWHVNSTARGGGVAEMLRSYLSYVRGAGVDARWMVTGGDDDFFAVTKRIHNHLHGDPGDGGRLSDSEREIYDTTLESASDELGNMVKPGDVVFLHDPQTAGLAKPMWEHGAHVVWRCHVGVDEPNDVVRGAWDFLRGYLDRAQALVFSRRQFVWDGFEDDRIWIMPPAIDAFSPKNQDMDPDTVALALETIGLGPDGSGLGAVFRRADGSKGEIKRPASILQSEPLAPDTPLVAQISRWDRLKDPVGLLICFGEHMGDETSHLALVGPDVQAVDDDPEGAECLREVRTALAAMPKAVSDRVHLVSLPMDDLEENAAMVNALQRRSSVVVQKSIAEGFGLTVAEAMWKERPVVAGRVGGIQDQIIDGESGVLVDDPADLAAVGAAIDGLLSDPDRAAEIGRSARLRVAESFLEIGRMVEYLRMVEQLMLSSEGR
jgi:trehalose synthase